MLTNGLIQIINDCNKVFHSTSLPYIVNPSIPILWFGDLGQYRNSGKRIVSVALNPSDVEFKSSPNNPPSIALRFGGISNSYSCQQYYNAMNNYFRLNPYHWFNSIEKVLNCLDASYYSGYSNTAIHIDVYAPVATTPHWNGLNARQKDLLKAGYSSFFQRLLNEFDPDVLLASFNSSEIKAHFIEIGGNPCVASNSRGFWRPDGKTKPFLRVHELMNSKILITGLNMSGSAFGGLYAHECQQGINSLRAQSHLSF